MERLTRRSADGRACFKPHLYGQMNKDVCDRLAAYEETGLEPEEMEQIKKAAAHMMFEDVAHFVRYTLSNFDELQRYKELGDYNRLRELDQAHKENRVLPEGSGWFVTCSGKKLTVVMDIEAALRREQE